MRRFSLFSPLFWIATTYVGLTYGPTVIGRLAGRVSKEQFTQALIEKSPASVQSVLSKTTDSTTEHNGSVRSQRTSRPVSLHQLPALPSNPREIPQYLQEVIGTTTTQVIEKSKETVSSTTQQTTQHICQQIVAEIQKKCDIQTSTE